VRTLKCDFCSAVLTDRAWECPARDFDYPELRVPIGSPAPVIGGSIGGWLACEKCAALVRDGRREELAVRAAKVNVRGLLPWRLVLAEIRQLHDQFWENRTGVPYLLDAEELDKARQEPDYMREQP
jgi:hypothetical protein